MATHGLGTPDHPLTDSVTNRVAQAAAVEHAGTLLKAPGLDKLDRRSERERVAEILATVRFGAGFGKELNKLLRKGIGVHHAGDVVDQADDLLGLHVAGRDAGSRDDLLEAWASALASTEALGHVPEEARVRASYSQILRLAGDPAAGRAQADTARAIAARLGAPSLLGDELADDPAPVTAPAGPKAALTPRELEILALVAEGRSNGEIGKQLFISTKTVSVHVSTILGKLAASSRTEAAAIARRENLLP